MLHASISISSIEGRKSSVQFENSTLDDREHVSHRQNKPPWVSKFLLQCRYADSKLSTLKEIIIPTPSRRRYSAHVVRYSGENVELGLKILAHVHNGSNIATAIAVVGC